MFHGDIIRIGIEEENTERKRKVFPLTLKPHKLPAPACSSVITDAPNRTQKQVPLCPLCHPSVASMTSGQTGRSPSIPKRASSLELPAWTSPSVVRFSWDCETWDSGTSENLSGFPSVELPMAPPAESLRLHWFSSDAFLTPHFAQPEAASPAHT